MDAYLARDGLLRYSDGKSTWLEFRPRAELERAAVTWVTSPITDEHPPDMLTAETAAAHTLGVVSGTPTIEVVDGVGYLRAQITVLDAALIAKIDAGQRELSIGFWSNVVVKVGVVDGRRFDAIQTDMIGNHVASVPLGRAGPRVRVLMDTAGAAVHTEDDPAMWTITVPATLVATHYVAALQKRDAAGMPVTESKLVGPDGTELVVPTWLAALVEQGIAAQGGEGAPVTEPTDDPAAEPMADPADDPVAEPPPTDPAAADPIGQKPEDDEKDMPEKAPPFSRDAATALIRSRARLERLASKAGVPERSDDEKATTLDSDDADLARALVKIVLPRAKVDGLDGPGLYSLVNLAGEELAARPAPEAANPFEVRAPARRDAEPNPEDVVQLKLLRAAGVEI